MNARVKTAAKKAMRRKTGKLFMISLFSLFLRILLISMCIFTVYALSTKAVQDYISAFSPNLLTSYFIYLAFAVLILLAIQTAAAIKIGETEYYGICAGGGIARMSVLFSHCSPFSALKALTLYVVIGIFKLIWLIVMLAPSAAVVSVALLLYYDSGVLVRVFATLCVTAAFLLCVGLACWYTSMQKYCFAALISAKCKNFSPRNAIRRSIAVFDCSAINPAAVKMSLIVPILSCVLIFPIIYVLPLVRMCMAAVYTESKKNAKLITHTTENKPVVLHTKKSYNW